MIAGRSKVNITPMKSVNMDGMIRAHASEGIHDPIHARAIVFGNSSEPQDCWALVSLDLCGLETSDYARAQQAVEKKTGIPCDRIIIAATHTHSGPAAYGFFDEKETEYVNDLMEQISQAVSEAFRFAKPAVCSIGTGEETTISNYRRLMSKSGKVIMNWEPFDPEDIVGPLGEIDPEVGVIKFSDPQTNEPIAVFFNHAGHPNVMSGDNYLISGDYTGYAQCKLEADLECVSAFFNGAQGTMDIDGLKDRDWEGVERAGTALATAVENVIDKMDAGETPFIKGENASFDVPVRRITDEEYSWAMKIVAETGGKVEAMADGVGDDYKAVLLKGIRESGITHHTFKITCIAFGDTALISYPGELYTEIGMQIKKMSPFKKTFILGIANGCEGYLPTRKAISEGGYAEDVRELADETEVIVTDEMLKLLNKVYAG